MKEDFKTLTRGSVLSTGAGATVPGGTFTDSGTGQGLDVLHSKGSPETEQCGFILRNSFISRCY